jgi:hypothetical protein
VPKYLLKTILLPQIGIHLIVIHSEHTMQSAREDALIDIYIFSNAASQTTNVIVSPKREGGKQYNHPRYMC